MKMDTQNKIRILFMDVDGTLTDGKIYMSDKGELMKAFDIKDGCGIHDILPQNDIIPIIITARESKILENRCKELNILYLYQNCRNKKEKMYEVAAKFDIHPDSYGKLIHTAYIGDDILDISCMQIAEYSGCPQNAAEQVKK